MSLECSVCEMDIRGNPAKDCAEPHCPARRTLTRAHIGTPVPVEQHLWPIHADAYHEFISDMCQNIPAEWDDDVAVEDIILKYVRHLESLVPPERRLPVTEADVQRAVMIADLDACDEFD